MGVALPSLTKTVHHAVHLPGGRLLDFPLKVRFKACRRSMPCLRLHVPRRACIPTKVLFGGGGRVSCRAYQRPAHPGFIEMSHVVFRTTTAIGGAPPWGYGCNLMHACAVCSPVLRLARASLLNDRKPSHSTSLFSRIQ